MLTRVLSRGHTRRCISYKSALTRQRRLLAQAAQVEVVERAEAAPAVSLGDSGSEPQSGPAAAHATTGYSGADGAYDVKMADLDAQRFRLHSSVSFWQEQQSVINNMWVDADPSNIGSNVQQLIQRTVGSSVWRDPQSAAYWTYHTARMSFFLSQGIVGVTAHHLSETLPSSLLTLTGLQQAPPAVVEASAAPSNAGSPHLFAAPVDGRTPLQRLLSTGAQGLASRLGEAVTTFSQDYENIKAGYYKMPWDMAATHRQNNPLFALSRTRLMVQETVATLQRRVRGQAEPVWLSSGMYPAYYSNTFHYQTDGWFSDRSARVYEHNTEVLFTGRQDAMQRTSLLPLADFVREAAEAGRPSSSLRLLEVAAGTGRFHTFIKDNYPDMPSVVSDLSPFYLARARENLAYWRATRQPNNRQLGGVEGTGVDFLQTAAEAIDAPNESFDVVVSVYLFHELPEAARAAAAAEFYRVLRPGGLLVITDSVQTGDRPAWDKTMGVFGDFNEPYYRSYISTDLGALFESAGFICDTKYVCSASKTLSFRKPGRLDPDAV